MTTEQTRTRDDFRTSLAEKYRRQGYQVVIEPTVGDLPAFLRSFRPDLLARRGNEGVVVEIKERGRRPTADELKAMSDAVAREIGWRLDVALLEPEAPPEVLPSIQQLDSALKDSERLFQTNQRPAALLLAWSALEAAAKANMQRRGVDISRPLAPLDLLKMLVSHGALDESEYRILADVGHLRNRVAHGSLSYDVANEEFSKVTAIARRLLNFEHDAAA